MKNPSLQIGGIRVMFLAVAFGLMVDLGKTTITLLSLP